MMASPNNLSAEFQREMVEDARTKVYSRFCKLGLVTAVRGFDVHVRFWLDEQAHIVLQFHEGAAVQIWEGSTQEFNGLEDAWLLLALAGAVEKAKQGDLFEGAAYWV